MNNIGNDRFIIYEEPENRFTGRTYVLRKEDLNGKTAETYVKGLTAEQRRALSVKTFYGLIGKFLNFFDKTQEVTIGNLHDNGVHRVYLQNTSLGKHLLAYSEANDSSFVTNVETKVTELRKVPSFFTGIDRVRGIQAKYKTTHEAFMNLKYRFSVERMNNQSLETLFPSVVNSKVQRDQELDDIHQKLEELHVTHEVSKSNGTVAIIIKDDELKKLLANSELQMKLAQLSKSSKVNFELIVNISQKKEMIIDVLNNIYIFCQEQNFTCLRLYARFNYFLPEAFLLKVHPSIIMMELNNTHPLWGNSVTYIRNLSKQE